MGSGNVDRILGVEEVLDDAAVEANQSQPSRHRCPKAIDAPPPHVEPPHSYGQEAYEGDALEQSAEHHSSW